MKLTLLEIVQNILSDMDSDNVNSIDDTIEAQQVALIVKDAFMNLTANRNWHNQKTMLQFDGLGDTDRPNYLSTPSELKELLTFRYNCKTSKDDKEDWKEVRYLDPEDFLKMCSRRDSKKDNVVIITDFSGTPLLIENNKAPNFWTTFDDEYIVCDSWNSEIDETLYADKTQAIGYVLKDFVMDNDAYPPIPEEAFPALIQAAKSQAFLVLKNVENPKAETEYQKQEKWLSRKNWRLHGGIRYPNYGRRRMK